MRPFEAAKRPQTSASTSLFGTFLGLKGKPENRRVFERTGPRSNDYRSPQPRRATLPAPTYIGGKKLSPNVFDRAEGRDQVIVCSGSATRKQTKKRSPDSFSPPCLRHGSQNALGDSFFLCFSSGAPKKLSPDPSRRSSRTH